MFSPPETPTPTGDLTFRQTLYVWTAQGIANQLRPLVRRGWVVRVGGHYTATDRAREAASW